MAQAQRFVARLTINEHSFAAAALLGAFGAYAAWNAGAGAEGHVGWPTLLIMAGFCTIALVLGLHWLIILIPSRRMLLMDDEAITLNHGARSLKLPLSKLRGASVYDAPSRFNLRTRAFVVLRIHEPSEAMERFAAESGGHLFISLQFRDLSDDVARALNARLQEWD